MSTAAPVTAPVTPNTLRAGLCQMRVGANKDRNLQTAADAIDRAVALGAKLVVLPECFQCPYDTTAFPEYQEAIPDVGTAAKHISPTENKSTFHLSQLALKHQIFLVGGSIPERGIDLDSDLVKTYNTSVVFDPAGTIVAKHRKLHLFDINIPGKITFRESDSLTPGDQVTTFSIPSDGFVLNKSDGFRDEIKVGVGICYDIRFSEYALVARQHYNTDAIIYPGAFNMTTGPAHWELLQKARALDNQMYVMSCSPARSIPDDPDNINTATGKPYTYVAWGHSTAIGPWGDVLGTTEHESDVVIADLDFQRMDEIRAQIPISFQRKDHVYQVAHKPKM